MARFKTITHDGVRYAVTNDPDGTATLTPLHSLISEGGKVSYNSRVYTVVTKFSHNGGTDYAVLHNVRAKRSPFTVAKVEDLRPVTTPTVTTP